MDGFFERLDALTADAEFVVDRPRGSAHPRYPDAVYPVDYGHLGGTTSVDGGGIDVFRGVCGDGVRGVLLTVDLGKRDAEIKVLLDCSAEEMRVVRRFCVDALGIGGELLPR